MKPQVKVLWLSPFLFVPPVRGGSIRHFYLVKYLASDFDLTVMTPPFLAHETVRALPYLRDLKGVRLIHPDLLPAAKESFWGEGIYWQAWDSFYWRFHPLRQKHVPLYRWHAVLDDFIRTEHPDAVILEHVWSIQTLALLKKRFPNLKFILNAHNIESLNLKRYLRGDGPGVLPGWLVKDQVRRILAAESNLNGIVDLVWACSHKDLNILRFLNRPAAFDGAVIPNGVETSSFGFDRGCGPDREDLIFTGVLNYPPALDGLVWFYERVWPLVAKQDPRIGVQIAGLDPPEKLREISRREPRWTLAANVADIRACYRNAFASICPLLSGSGTRIKILEAMSLGVPVVSTSVGAEGIEAEPSRHLWTADNPEHFAQGILRLKRDADFYHGMRTHARRLVEERYDWEIIVRTAAESIAELFKTPEKKTASAGTRP